MITGPMSYRGTGVVIRILAGILLLTSVVEGDPDIPTPTDVPYGTAQWPEDRGNHRALVRVTEKAEAVVVRIPWRRRDLNPQGHAIWVYDAATNKRLRNVVCPVVTRAEGYIALEPPTTPGVYEVYYLPGKWAGKWWHPTTEYAKPENTADPKWLERAGLAGEVTRAKLESLPQAVVTEIQSRGEFHSFYPMEIVATDEEVAGLLAAHDNRTYLVFPEDRRYPIRMREFLPQRWIAQGPRNIFQGRARPNEYYVFQLGIYAAKSKLGPFELSFSPLTHEKGEATIAPTHFDCINLGGVDWFGRPFRKEITVPKGGVQALWIGLDIPSETEKSPGTYRGKLTIRPRDAEPTDVNIAIEIEGKVLEDRGDSELWRHSRLRWLNSTIAQDNEPTVPFLPLEVAGRTIRFLGRRVELADTGMPASILSYFAPTVDRLSEDGREILESPIRLTVLGEGNQVHRWSGDAPAIRQTARGLVEWVAKSEGEQGLDLECRGRMEPDGFIDLRMTLNARKDATLNDVCLEVPVRADVARFMFGLGRKGGHRPVSWDWKWDLKLANYMIWLGDVNAGLQCKLRGPKDFWSLYGLSEQIVPRSWYNDGQGGCRVEESGSAVVFRAFSGPRKLVAGSTIEFRASFLVTPLRLLDLRHWDRRYYHAQTGKGGVNDVGQWLRDAKQAGAKVINVHQAAPINPFINYPFVKADAIRVFAEQVHAADMRLLLYYTVRELSVHAAELWAFRSLGDEIFTDGPGFRLADHFSETPQEHLKPGEGVHGHPWLCEHLVSGYLPAWHTPLDDGGWDISIATSGLSRLHNYYLQGLDWLVRHDGVDGIYIDGIGYDRTIMKRVRKVLDQARPGCLIDFHSGNNFAPVYGLGNVLLQYMEHLPYMDSLWIGEGFDYNESPDYWLVEIAGIPFGLFSEMLQKGGNPWRGMIYGMTNRLPWSGNPAEIWKLWDTFGIREADMIGYWVPLCPVRTDQPDILATVYRRADRSLISLASWAPEKRDVTLRVNWPALGLDPARTRLRAPEVPNFQPPAEFSPGDPIPIEPARGWLLIAEPAKE